MLGDVTENIHLSSRNIRNTIVFAALNASTYDLLDCQLILADVASVKILNNQLSK